MTIEEILLALLAQNARSGYDLKKWLDVEGIFFRANADQAHIYRALRVLERQGLVDFRKEQRGGPAAKVYFLTDAGIARLREAAAAPYEPPARWQEPDFLARFTLLGPIHPSALRDQVATEIAFREEQIRRYRNRDRSFTLGENSAGIDPDVLILVGDASHYSGITQLDLWLSWLRSLESTLLSDARVAPSIDGRLAIGMSGSA
ncbi:PadR family transcriptional regulator [Microbacterium sp. LWS13-1.2]|uniref:PadR family transcriptional regulator n=1 Tax=Microbacterium sp. LWS13-1.2 TaxID=3135264 RepID=A0AAU6SAU1_9MICO